MRTTAFVLGIVGGILGIIMALVAMAVGGAANALKEESGDAVVGLAVSALAAAAFGILCVGLYFGGKKRTLMSWGVLIAAIWHTVSISFFGIPGGLLLLLAAVFAWFGRKQRTMAPAPTLLLAAGLLVAFGGVAVGVVAATRSAPGLAITVTLNKSTLKPGESGTATIRSASGGRCSAEVHLQTRYPDGIYIFERADVNGYLARSFAVPKNARTGAGLFVAHCWKGTTTGMAYAQFTIAPP